MIHFFIEDVVFRLPNQKSVARWLTQIALYEHKAISEISYIFCSDEYLLKINQQYLHHDYYTDVITFDHRDVPDAPLQADIFISYERVTDNARQLNCSPNDEILRVMAHGLLHLIGYNDATPKEKKLMRVLEDTYLEKYISL